MSLQAAAGKNPVSHVGKIYNVLARDIATRILQAAAAECYVVSEIGKLVETPALTHVRLATHDGSPADRLESAIGDVVTRQIRGIPDLVDRSVVGTIPLF